MLVPVLLGQFSALVTSFYHHQYRSSIPPMGDSQLLDFLLLQQRNAHVKQVDDIAVLTGGSEQGSCLCICTNG